MKPKDRTYGRCENLAWFLRHGTSEDGRELLDAAADLLEEYGALINRLRAATGEPPQFVKLSDLPPPPPSRVSLEDGQILLRIRQDRHAYEYPIDLGRCDTPEKVLAWCEHLSHKNWVDQRMLREFIQLAARCNPGVQIDRHM